MNHTTKSVARRKRKKDMTFGSAAVTQDKHQHGVGFIVNKTRIKSVISCTPVSSRIITIRISAEPGSITIVYAPTSANEEDLVEEFYKQIESVNKEGIRKNFPILHGDWNAKVGPDAYE